MTSKYGLRENPKQKFDAEEWEGTQQTKLKKQNSKNKNKSTSHGGASGNDNPEPGQAQKLSASNDRTTAKKRRGSDLCRFCEKQFREKELAMHEAMCAKLGKKDSFFKLVRQEVDNRTPSELSEKVALPDSQPAVVETQQMEQSNLLPTPEDDPSAREVPTESVDFNIGLEMLEDDSNGIGISSEKPSSEKSGSEKSGSKQHSKQTKSKVNKDKTKN